MRACAASTRAAAGCAPPRGPAGARARAAAATAASGAAALARSAKRLQRSIRNRAPSPLAPVASARAGPHHRLDGVGARENRADGDDGGGRRGPAACALPDEAKDLLAAPQHDRADARGTQPEPADARWRATKAAAERRPGATLGAAPNAAATPRRARPRRAVSARTGFFGRDGGGLAHDLHSEAHVPGELLSRRSTPRHTGATSQSTGASRVLRVERRAQKRSAAAAAAIIFTVGGQDRPWSSSAAPPWRGSPRGSAREARSRAGPTRTAPPPRRASGAISTSRPRGARRSNAARRLDLESGLI